MTIIRDSRKQPGRLIQHLLHLGITGASLGRGYTHLHGASTAEDHLLATPLLRDPAPTKAAHWGSHRTHASGHGLLPLGPPDLSPRELELGFQLMNCKALDLLGSVKWE